MSAEETSAEQNLKERFRTIAAQAKLTNEARVRELSAAIDRLTYGTLTEDERADAAAVAHKLAGSAGTFGYRGVSETASLLEAWLVADRSESSDRSEDPAQPGRWVDELIAGLAADPDDPDG